MLACQELRIKETRREIKGKGRLQKAARKLKNVLFIFA
jgi:hypothetical protein